MFQHQESRPIFLVSAFVILLLSALAPASFGARADDSREELRRLLKLPEMHWAFGAGISSLRGLALNGVKPEPAEIADLRQRVKENAADGEARLKLASLLSQTGEAVEAGRTGSNAVTLLRAQCEQRPNDVRLQVCLGQALDFIGSPEAVSVLRSATTAAPKSGEAWLGLGVCLSSSVLSKLLPEKSEPTQDMMAFFNLMLSTSRPTAAQFEAAEQVQGEAVKALNMAVTLEPKNARAYEYRALGRMMAGILETIKKFDPAAQTEMPPVMMAIFEPEALPDIRRAAALAPEDPYLLAAAASYESYSLALKALGGKFTPTTFDKMTAYLSTEASEDVRRQIDCLNRLADGPVKNKAAMANEFLGCMQLMPLRQNAKAEASFRRALALDAERELSWDGLMAALVAQERYQEFLAAAQDRVKRKKSARNELIVAKAYDKLKRRDEELAHARVALALEPRDIQNHMAVVVALLHQKESPENFELASKQINQATELLREASREQKIYAHFTRAIFLALAGDPLAARGALRGVLEADPEHEDAKAALAIVQKW